MAGDTRAASVEDQVVAFVSSFFRLQPGDVSTSSQLVYDLGADSSDLLDLSIQLSQWFDCELDSRRVANLVCVADLCRAVELGLVEKICSCQR